MDVTLSDGSILELEDGLPPDQGNGRKAQAEEQIKAEAPQVPGAGHEESVSGETAPGYIPAGSDPSQSDPWGTWALKQAGSAVRGTGRGFAQLGDIEP